MKFFIKQRISLLLLFIFLVQTNEPRACTRVVYKGPANTFLTARSMDWNEDTQTDLWIFPRGMERNGETGPNTIKWRSKYGSVIASAYNVASTDGINEKGLVANLLWLAESEYPKWDPGKPGLTIAAWVQYVLDNFETVDEAVSELSQEKFIPYTSNVPGQDRLVTVHLSLSDATGDNAILEYIDGKLNIHHDRSYQVMTNSPPFDQQLALNDYWKNISGVVFLPGTNRAADRFVRASFYINAVPQTDDIMTATASVFSVIRNCSVPYGISTPNEPNISSTRWRTVSDQKNLIYYFESVISPNTFWVDLKDVDLSENAPVKKLPLTGGEIYAGNAAAQFIATPAFAFLGYEN
ncbi:MAG TPA: linear amide C-N hydrolase [Ignavibacteria bacterium]|nr:linear amide C-N hydrolase [Ignavibacteria bacterium]HMR41914.1 linear amide C-N hydrolase [Ignavibacteria bacterium]